MAGMCLNFVGPDALIGPLGGSFHRKSFAAPAASSFLHGQKGTKEPPRGVGAIGRNGVAAPASMPPTPWTPVYGGYPLGQAEHFRRAKSEWLV